MSNASSKDRQLKEKSHHNGNIIKELGGPIRVTASAIFIFFLSQFFAVLVVSLGVSLLNPSAETPKELVESAKVQFLIVLLAEALVVFTILKILKRHNLNLNTIGLGRLPRLSDVGRAFLGFASFFAVIILINIALNAFFPELKDQKQDVGFDNLRDSLDKILAFISLVVLAPVGEEVLMRGYLYSGLRKYLKFLPAMFVTSLLFGLAHLQTGEGSAILWAAGVNTFVLSLILVYLREKTGALYASILVHAANNFIAFSVYFRGALF